MRVYSSRLEELFHPHSVEFIREFLFRTFTYEGGSSLEGATVTDSDIIIEFKHKLYPDGTYDYLYTIADMPEENVVEFFRRFLKVKAFL